MAVWLPLRLEPTAGSADPTKALEGRAIVSSAYRADVEQISLPAAVAELLGFWPNLPDDSVEAEVE